MIKAESIQNIIKDALKERQLFLVDVLVTPANKITVYIDSMEGVTIDDCAGISRLIESGLNRKDQDYELEVSSPGQERSLMLPVQYEKNIGRKVDVLKKDGIWHQGLLKSFSEGHVRIEADHLVRDEQTGKKRKMTRITEIEIDQIIKAKITVSQ